MLAAAPTRRLPLLPPIGGLDSNLAGLVDTFRGWLATSLVRLAERAFEQGATPEATELLSESMDLFGRSDQDRGVLLCLERLAQTAADHERVAQLHAVADALRERKLTPAVAATRASSMLSRVQCSLPAQVLTSRERDVARLVVKGYSNRQISNALVIAHGTVTVHIKHILAKLGFVSRAQIAVWVTQQAWTGV